MNRPKLVGTGPHGLQVVRGSPGRPYRQVVERGTQRVGARSRGVGHGARRGTGHGACPGSTAAGGFEGIARPPGRAFCTLRPQLIQQLGRELEDAGRDPAQHLRHPGAAGRGRRPVAAAGPGRPGRALPAGSVPQGGRLEEEGLLDRLPDPHGRPRRAGADQQAGRAALRGGLGGDTWPASNATSRRGSATRRPPCWPGCSDRG